MREPTSRGPRKPAPADDDDDDNLSDEEPPVEEEPFEIPAVCAGACTLQSRVLSRKLSRTRELMTFQQAYKYEEIEARCIICYGFDLLLVSRALPQDSDLADEGDLAPLPNANAAVSDEDEAKAAALISEARPLAGRWS